MTPQERLEIRAALAALPEVAHHAPGQPVDPDDVYMVQSHRNALNPDRALVVGNRGMGKSFWAHALTNPIVRERLANELQLQRLAVTQVVFGFNGSAAHDAVAPTPAMLDGHDPAAAWKAVLARAVASYLGEVLPGDFTTQVDWIARQPEAYAALLSRGEGALRAQGRHLLVLFDALDRLGSDWTHTRQRLQALLGLALQTQSFRHIRLKLFLRFDQFGDPRLFEFPDAAKIRNTAVDLAWPDEDLYALLFFNLRHCPAFQALTSTIDPQANDRTKQVVDALAGEYMGKGKRKGRVYTWLPTHLKDTHGHISPRTFLTVWRAAAESTRAEETPIDHLGIHEGVRRASRARLAELEEDYPWVMTALEPLRNREVPLERQKLEDYWRESDTFARVQTIAQERDRHVLIPIQLSFLLGEKPSHEEELRRALEVIGVLELRKSLGTIDVPDIYRVEAGIKRRGGVQPKRR